MDTTQSIGDLFLLYGGIAIAGLGAFLLIAGGVYNGVTKRTDGWFWALIIIGAILLILGFFMALLGFILRNRAAPSPAKVKSIESGKSIIITTET